MGREGDWQAIGGLGDSVHNVEETLAAAATIAPTKRIVIVTGTTQIATITPPWDKFAGDITLIFTDASPGATLTTGNIQLATTVVRYKALKMTYSQQTGKWYPSY